MTASPKKRSRGRPLGSTSLRDHAGEVGKRLASVRIERGLSQQDVAAAAGVAHQQVHLWEQGHPPNLSSAVKLSRALGVSVHWIATGEGERDL